jgi:hypothetical protein
MELQELLTGARDAVTVKRVYGEPYEKNGLTVIPAATVRGGGGGGGGHHGDDDEGSGGGFGLTAHPAGAWVIENGKADWKPAVDVNKIVAGGQLVALAAIFVTGRVLLARSRRSRTLLERVPDLPELKRPHWGRHHRRRELLALRRAVRV